MSSAADQVLRRAQPWLGTLVDISIMVNAADADAGLRAMDAAFAAVALVHRLMSFHDGASDVSAINRLQPGESADVDAHTICVLRCAQLLEEASDGVFNIACGAQLVAWGQLPAPAGAGGAPAWHGSAASTTSAASTASAYSASSASSVSSTYLASSATSAGSPAAPIGSMQRADAYAAEDTRERPPARDAWSLDAHRRVTKLLPAWIDLGGIAKGYAVDLAVEALQAAGVVAGCVNAGGDLRVFGDVDFPIVIRNPQAPTRAACKLQLRQQALATSADYFSSRMHEGRRTSALLDTRCGQPVQTGRSASVLAPSCMLADGLTKIVIATDNAAHPVLARFDATAFLV